MTWFISKEAHYQVIKELEEQTDRGAAIIAAAFLDERLSEAILSRLRPLPDVTDKLLSSSGPVGTFSAKIDLAYALGYYGERSHRDLHLVRKIRNKFAHTLEPTGFNTESISHWCAELWLPQNVLEMGRDTPPSEPRAQYLSAVNILNSLIWSEMSSSITKDRGKVEEPYFLRW